MRRYKKFINLGFLSTVTTLLISGCGGGSNNSEQNVVETEIPPVAVLADVHFADVYSKFNNPGFAGIPTKDGKFATIRTMHAQLTSTRLFNENYFAFLAALDDVYAKGIRLVVIPGDYSDDGQPINIDGIDSILRKYKDKGMRIFLTSGNHDPVAPFDNREAGKSDFLNEQGKEQKIYATDNAECKLNNPNYICTDQLMQYGYEKLMTQLGDFGFMPNKNDIYWETPFSNYSEKNYDYKQASESGKLINRQYEICAEGSGGEYKNEGEIEQGKAFTKCTKIVDSSYLVEPVNGLWLLLIDSNVYIPNNNFDAANPNNFKGFNGSGNAGWNKVLTHKKHVLKWMQSVAERAKAEGKVLIPFSHYPVMDFYANQTDNIKAVFKPGAFQTARTPELSTTEAVAKTGIKFHIGGHMHFNGTNEYKNNAGDYLVGVQLPSLAVFGSSYKTVKYKSKEVFDIKTVMLNDVAGFNELFGFYKKESDYLNASDISSDIDKRWNADILNVNSYGEFTRFYFGELSRLRFMKDYWPCEMKEAAMSLNVQQMLILSQLKTQVTFAQLKEVPDVLPLTDSCMAPGAASQTSVPASQLVADWAKARLDAEKLANAAGFTLEDFAKISAYEFYGDFHRTAYAGELALLEMGEKRVNQYRVLMNAFPENPESIILIDKKPSDQNHVNDLFQNQFKQVFGILKGLGSGKPSNNFTMDFERKEVYNSDNSAISFN